MPRKGPAPRRELVADPIHKSVLVTQITNKVMLHGKRTVAEKIVYDAMDIIQSRLEGDEMAIDTVKRAIENVKPPLEVRSRRVGVATYQVAVEVRPLRETKLEIRWNVEYGAPRPGDVRDSLADITAAREAFGFDPKVEMYEGLVEYVAWAKTLVDA